MADLGELVGRMFVLIRGRCETLRHRGPPVELLGRVASALGMALHELCTNAVKYGRLVGAKWPVRIDWRLGEGCTWSGREGRPKGYAPAKRVLVRNSFKQLFLSAQLRSTIVRRVWCAESISVEWKRTRMGTK